ncbi:hypothetical protein CERSUDRAFT_71500 [Gelatoporia subvermispora B]|uniref:Uncharacterized protein n=1 Tax=Ceriporiopsis subvermispora (strain B) TaxID=914234 RepID=M2QR99_CERS8|nr:hypothetical protein CERSUDRAFT_71500 [Gelatoporia subvermispora B]
MSPPIEFQPQFGVEFEMVVKNIRRHFDCSGTEESKVFAIMAQQISNGSGQDVRSTLDKDVSDIQTLDTRPWTIVQDASIREFSKVSEKEQHSPKSKQDRTSLELVSPVLPWDSSGKGALKRVVDFIRDTWRPATNDTTGFHVHIGNDAVSEGELPFTFEQLKQLAKMCSLFEEVIDGFHPPDRAGREPEDSEYTLSNVANSFFATCQTKADRVEKLEKNVRGVQGIVDCMNRDSDKQGDTGSKKRYYKVNFASLFKHGSIEFRQHQGELRYDRIELWVSFLVEFVRASIAMTDDKIRTLAENPVTLDVLVTDVVKNEKYRRLVWKDYMKAISAPVEEQIRVLSNKDSRKERQKQEKALSGVKLAGLPAGRARGGTDRSQVAGPSTLESAVEQNASEKMPVENALIEATGEAHNLSKVKHESQSSKEPGLRGDHLGLEPPTSYDGDVESSSSDEDGLDKVRRKLWSSSDKQPVKKKGMDGDDKDLFAI